MISQYCLWFSSPNSSMIWLSFAFAVLFDATIERMSFRTAPGARTFAAM